jgi:hypothetical protein
VALLSALDNITNSTAAHPMMVKIEPGIYDLDGRSLLMKPYVDIEGSGEGSTTIASAVDSGYGVVVGADNAELRFLSLRNSSTAALAVGFSLDSTSPRVSHVTAFAGGAAVNYAIRAASGSPVFDHVTAIASGGSQTVALNVLGGLVTARDSTFRAADGDGANEAVLGSYSGETVIVRSTMSASGPLAIGFRSFNGAHLFTDVSITATSSDGTSWAIYNGHRVSNSVLTIHQSRISGGTLGLLAVSGPVKLGGSQLSGPISVAPAATVICAASYDGAFDALGPDCT